MGQVLVIGPAVQVDGWALAGADVALAQDAEQAVAQLASPPPDLALVVVAAPLRDCVAQHLPAGVLMAVLPT